MNNDEMNSKVVTSIDQEQVKAIAGTLRKYSADLDTIKNEADMIWTNCETYLDSSIVASIRTVKGINKKRYMAAIEELNNYINKLETVVNIWKDTEDEIKASSIKLENIFSDIGKALSSIDNKKEE